VLLSAAAAAAGLASTNENESLKLGTRHRGGCINCYFASVLLLLSFFFFTNKHECALYFFSSIFSLDRVSNLANIYFLVGQKRENK
jgi:hypothetical protein